MPEHCIHRVMPRLMLAQRGSGCPQSQQQTLPGMARTFCRALSPFSDLSFGSPPESRLPVDVDDFLSSFWQERNGEGAQTKIKDKADVLKWVNKNWSSGEKMQEANSQWKTLLFAEIYTNKCCKINRNPATLVLSQKTLYLGFLVYVWVFTSLSSPLSRKAVAMLFWTALIQACRSFSESACIIQLLWGQTSVTQLLSAQSRSVGTRRRVGWCSTLPPF